MITTVNKLNRYYQSPTVNTDITSDQYKEINTIHHMTADILSDQYLAINTYQIYLR